MKNPVIYVTSEMYRSGMYQEMVNDFVHQDYKGFFHRLKCAWGAFTGKYDLVKWRDKSTVFSKLDMRKFKLLKTEGKLRTFTYDLTNLFIYSRDKFKDIGLFIGNRIEYKAETHEIIEIDSGTDRWNIKNPVKILTKNLGV